MAKIVFFERLFRYQLQKKEFKFLFGECWPPVYSYKAKGQRIGEFLTVNAL
jgi:hypothetical protein